MSLSPPSFWYQKRGGAWLTPFGLLYGFGGALRQRLTKPQKVDVPVICVGNLVAGGAGKTPVVLALVDFLQSKGIEVHILIRGYGGKLSRPTRVDLHHHTYKDVGDEALLLASQAPTWVGANRVATAKAATSAGAEILVMDDGFQNPSLAKDLSLLVVDGATGFGNRRVIPAGPLREPIRRGLKRAQAIVMLGWDQTHVTRSLDPYKPLLRAHLVPIPDTAAKLKGQRVVAFAGIGNPGKFFTTCQGVGAEVVKAIPYPDHYVYKTRDLQRLQNLAHQQRALLVTTTKDAVRLPISFRNQVIILPVSLVWDDISILDNLCRERLGL